MEQHTDIHENPNLSPQQIEVLKNLLQGLSNKEIALNMGLAEVTVRLHLKGIFKKLGAKNRVHAIARALALGLP